MTRGEIRRYSRRRASRRLGCWLDRFTNSWCFRLCRRGKSKDSRAYQEHAAYGRHGGEPMACTGRTDRAGGSGASKNNGWCGERSRSNARNTYVCLTLRTYNHVVPRHLTGYTASAITHSGVALVAVGRS